MKTGYRIQDSVILDVCRLDKSSSPESCILNPFLRCIRMALSVRVSRVSRDEVTHPPEEAARAYPYAGSDDQPKDTAQYLAVINLTYARNEET